MFRKKRFANPSFLSMRRKNCYERSVRVVSFRLFFLSIKKRKVMMVCLCAGLLLLSASDY